jgi:hypothetical protein
MGPTRYQGEASQQQESLVSPGSTGGRSRGRQGEQAPVRVKNSRACVGYALVSRWWWRERRPSVEVGDAGEPIFEVHVL